MKKSVLYLSLFLIFSAFLSSCLYSPVALVPSNIPIIGEFSITKERISAEACDVRVLLIPIYGSSRMETAMDELKLRSGGRPLVEVTVARELSYYFLFHTECTVVTGFAVNQGNMGIGSQNGFKAKKKLPKIKIIEEPLECSDAVLHYNKLKSDFEWKCGGESIATNYSKDITCGARKAEIENFRSKYFQCF